MLKLIAAGAALAAFTMLAPAPAAAQDTRAPTAEEIIQKLLQPKLNPDDLKSNAVQVEGRRSRAAPSPGTAPSIDLAVNFEYASAQLTPDARLTLDNLGQALTDPALASSRFRIAGHTDARGGDEYNLALSRQRARSVAEYLMSQYHIDAQRLTVEGYGRTRLRDPANPASAVNRRVEVTNLGK